ncbi:MAG: aminopeptidase P family N-terminal domain-containing protein [Clostridia bacterium]
MSKPAELIEKLARVREMMQEKKLDGVYLKRQDSFAWLTCGGTNYIGQGELGLCGLLVTHDSTYAITNNIEAPRVRDEENLEELGFEIHYATWYENQFENQTIDKIMKNGVVGYDFGTDRGINIAGAMKFMRFSLTDGEIERYKVGGLLAARIIEQTLAESYPGQTERELIGRVASKTRAQGMDVISTMCAADHRIYNYRHPIGTFNAIKERVQLGGNFNYKGLVICCSRFANFVPVTDELQEQYIKNTEIDCTFMLNSIPGNTYVSALEAGKKAYEERGYGDEFLKHHQGGPIGYAAREYRVDFSTPGLIQENQAFCWNPSVTGTKSEDTIIATSNGIIPVSKPIMCPTIEVEVDGHKFTRSNIWEIL